MPNNPTAHPSSGQESRDVPPSTVTSHRGRTRAKNLWGAPTTTATSSTTSQNTSSSIIQQSQPTHTISSSSSSSDSSSSGSSPRHTGHTQHPVQPGVYNEMFTLMEISERQSANSAMERRAIRHREQYDSALRNQNVKGKKRPPPPPLETLPSSATSIRHLIGGGLASSCLIDTDDETVGGGSGSSTKGNNTSTTTATPATVTTTTSYSNHISTTDINTNNSNQATATTTTTITAVPGLVTAPSRDNGNDDDDDDDDDEIVVVSASDRSERRSRLPSSRPSSSHVPPNSTNIHIPSTMKPSGGIAFPPPPLNSTTVSVFALYHSDPAASQNHMHRDTLQYLNSVRCPAVMPYFPYKHSTDRHSTLPLGITSGINAISPTEAYNGHDIVLYFTPLSVARQIVDNIRNFLNPLHNIYSATRFKTTFPTSICGGYLRRDERTPVTTINSDNPIVLDSEDEHNRHDISAGDDGSNASNTTSPSSRGSSSGTDNNTISSTSASAPPPAKRPRTNNNSTTTVTTATSSNSTTDSSSNNVIFSLISPDIRRSIAVHSPFPHPDDKHTATTRRNYETPLTDAHLAFIYNINRNNNNINIHETTNLQGEDCVIFNTGIMESLLSILRQDADTNDDIKAFLGRVQTEYLEWYDRVIGRTNRVSGRGNSGSSNSTRLLGNRANNHHDNDISSSHTDIFEIVTSESGTDDDELPTQIPLSIDPLTGKTKRMHNQEDRQDNMDDSPSSDNNSNSNSNNSNINEKEEEEDDDDIFFDGDNPSTSPVPLSAPTANTVNVSNNVKPRKHRTVGFYIPLESSSPSNLEIFTAAKSRMECPICISGMHNRVLAATSCGHMACFNCLCRAIRVSNKCPACRKPQTVKDIIKLFG